jgi:hypothetical protein
MSEELVVKITADDQASSVLKGLGGTLSSVSNIAGTIFKTGLMAGTAGLAALAGGIGVSIKAASEAEKIDAQLGAVLKSTGGAAGVTKDQVLKLSDALSKVTPFEDDMITATQTVLLQFKNLNKDVFPQTTKLSLDLAQRMGTDTTSAAKLLGKALETPGEGLAKLKAAGVSFNDEQEKMIKKMSESGNTAGAQALILKELEKSIGGAAEAAGNTFAGQLTILQNELGNVQETVGAAFLPSLTTAVQWINKEAIPKASEFAGNIAGITTALSNAAKSGDWSVLAGALSKLLPADMSQDIATLIGRVSDGIKTGDWKPAWDSFSTMFWKATDSVLNLAAEKLSGLLTELNLLLLDSENQEVLNQAGHDIGVAIVNGMSSLFDTPDDPAWGDMKKSLGNGLAQFALSIHSTAWDIGVSIVVGIFDGMIGKLTNTTGLSDPLRQAFEDAIKNTVITALSAIFPAIAIGRFVTGDLKLPGFAQGGVVPGALGQPQLAVVHGGEQVLTPDQQRSGFGGASSDYVVVGFNPASFQQFLQPFIESGVLQMRSRQVGAVR